MNTGPGSSIAVLYSPQWPSGQQVCHLITSSFLCLGLTLTSDYAENLSQYDPGC